MNHQDIHGFSSDRPIKTTADDLFDRANFAKGIAQALSSWHGKDSLVVALHGDWGSGKSSIKNMAVSELETMAIRPDIIEFSPWEWAAQDKITAAFFQEISAKLGQKKEERKLAAIFKKYSEYLSTGKVIIEEFNSSVLPSLYVLLPFLSAAGIFADSEPYKTISAVLLTVIGVAAAFINWGKSLAEKLGKSESNAKELSLTRLKKDLTDLLSKREKSLLVIMDDLDRLTSEQLRMVFQLVKANTEFPNVVFLLLFQRDLVEEKLNDGKQTGRDYLEKIIQVPFDIPKIEISRVHDALFRNIYQILEQNKSISDIFDRDYLGNVFCSSLYAYFDNLRKVYRFSSTFSFHVALFQGRSAFEVNPVDLIAIECMRVFEPEVYKGIARSKELLTTNRQQQSKENIAVLLTEHIIAKSTAGKSEYVTKLITYIFPPVAWAFGGMGYDDSFSQHWLKSMRICHPSNFDKYFQFSIPSGEVSHSDLQEMLALTSDREGLKNYLLTLRDPNRLKNTLIQFRAFIEKIPINNIKPFVFAILDIADQVENDRIAFEMASPNTCLIWLVIDFLKKIPDAAERGNVLLDCFQDSQGISVIEYILMGEEKRREKSDRDLLISEHEFNALKIEFVKRLNELSTNSPDTFLQNKHFLSCLYRWSQWGDKDKICSWLNGQIRDSKSCILVLRAFIYKSYSSGSDDYIQRITKDINLKNLEEFVSIDEIVETIRVIDKSVLNEEDLEAISIFNDDLELRNCENSRE